MSQIPARAPFSLHTRSARGLHRLAPASASAAAAASAAATGVAGVASAAFTASAAPTPRPSAIAAVAGPAVVAPATTSGRHWLRFLTSCLRATDALLIVVTVFAGYLLRSNGVAPFAPSDYNGRSITLALLLLVLWTGALEIYRTRDPKMLGVGAEEYKAVASASLRVFGFLAIVFVVLRLDPAGAFYIATLPAGLAALMGNRWVFRRWLTHEQAKGHYLSKAIVIGEAEDVRYVIKQIGKKSRAVYEILGASLPGARRGAGLNVDGQHVPVLSSTDDVVRTVGRTGANAVIVAGPLPGGNQFIRELGWRLEEHSAEMVLASTLTNVAGPRIHWRPVEGLPLMHVDIPHYSGAKHVLKRAVDIAASALALLILSPVLLALGLIIRHDSPGPVFFLQERVGKEGRSFRMVKFRSMVTTAESDLAALVAQNQGAGVLFKLQNDPRVTKCGRWMRKYSLDELPQFFNVLMGNMSLVGPRPPLAREVSGYERHTRRRLLIKPGITGLWQINGRSDLPWDDAVRLDLYYVENWSIAGDVMIMWRTFRAMLQPDGAY